MLLHSKVLNRTSYPEQVWLDGLKENSPEAEAEGQIAAPPAPKFVKPRDTGYKLRRLEAPTGDADLGEKPTALQKLMSFFKGSAA